MAKFQVTGPDGATYEVTAPDGATEQEAIAYVQQNVAGGGTPTMQQGEAPGAGERFLRGVKDPVDAGAQMLTRMLPQGVVGAVNDATAYVNQLPVIGPVTTALGMVPATTQSIDQDIQSAERDYQGRRGPDAGFDWMRLGGNIAATLPAASAVPATVPGAIAGGAALGTLQPVVGAEDNFWLQKGEQAALGGVGGLAGNLLGRGIARVVSPKTDPAVKALMDRGVTPTPGQILGRPFKAIEDKATSIPVLGDAVAAGQRRSMQDFNRAAYDDVLRVIGEAVPDNVGRDGLKAVGDKVSAAYDDVLPQLTFRADQKLSGDIGNLRAMASQLPEKEAAAFERYIRDKVARAMSPNGTMDGRTFKELESDLAREIATFGRSGDAYQQKLADAFGELLSTLRSTLQRSNHGVSVNVNGRTVDGATRLRDINEAWARLVRVERAGASTGATDGVFTPSQFSSAVKGADNSVRGRAFARGDALMQDMSDAGKSVLGDKYPDSGTAGRLATLLMGGGGVGLAATNPLLASGLAAAGGAAMLPYTALGQRLTAQLLTQRPDFAPQVAAAIRKTLPAAQAASAGALAQRR